MDDRKNILKHLKQEAARLEQALSELQTSAGEMVEKNVLVEEIATLLKDVNRLVHSIENPQEQSENV